MFDNASWAARLVGLLEMVDSSFCEGEYEAFVNFCGREFSSIIAFGSPVESSRGKSFVIGRFVILPFFCAYFRGSDKSISTNVKVCDDGKRPVDSLFGVRVHEDNIANFYSVLRRGSSFADFLVSFS